MCPSTPTRDSPEVLDVTVRGHGFEPATTVDIYLTVEGTESFPDPCASLTTDEVGVFEGKHRDTPAQRRAYVRGVRQYTG